MVQIMKETASVLEYKIGNNANIANVLCLWETRLKIQMKGEIAEDSEIEWLSPTSPCKVNEATNSFSRKNTIDLVFTTTASYFCFFSFINLSLCWYTDSWMVFSKMGNRISGRLNNFVQESYSVSQRKVIV